MSYPGPVTGLVVKFSDLALFRNTHSDRQDTIFHGILVSVILKGAELQIREDNEDNSKIICLISQQIHML